MTSIRNYYPVSISVGINKRKHPSLELDAVTDDKIQKKNISDRKIRKMIQMRK
jgi:hypothetical protein